MYKKKENSSLLRFLTYHSYLLVTHFQNLLNCTNLYSGNISRLLGSHGSYIQKKIITLIPWKRKRYEHILKINIRKFSLSSWKQKSPIQSELSFLLTPTTHLVRSPPVFGQNKTRGQITTANTKAANVLRWMSMAGRMLLLKSPWRPMKADSQRIVGREVWWPVAKKKTPPRTERYTLLNHSGTGRSKRGGNR